MLDIIIQDTIFVNNKYKRWYISIIENRVNNMPQEYFERHHIVPKCIRKDLSKNPNNIIKLTAKEHFICHLLLTKFTIGKYKSKMCAALLSMIRVNPYQNRKFTSGYYELVRKTYKTSAIGRTHTEETKKKISESNKGRVSPNKGNKYGGARTPEAKNKISEKKKGVALTEEHKKKLSQIKIGKKRGSYKKHKEYNKETCIYCNITTIKTNITRFHNEKCQDRKYSLSPHI